MASQRNHSVVVSLNLVIQLVLFATTSYLVWAKDKVDLCSPNGELDLSPLSSEFPWSVTNKIKNIQHYVDILPCGTFVQINNSIPNECVGNSICHQIRDVNNNQVNIGYTAISVIPEHKTYRVKYVGPHCENDLNYTIDIRFFCGNNLGYPNYPYIFTSKCTTILSWETSAACKSTSSQSVFGVNEMRCYVIDDDGKRRDLTPLIKPNGSYKVWSADKDFFMNVCTDALDTCGSTSSTCVRNTDGQLENTGSFKWSSIQFKKATELIHYDYVEMIYRTKTSKCINHSSNSALNISITTVRFICPKSMGLAPRRRYPALVSSLDCHYEIDWITEHACPQEEITSKGADCKFGDIDLSSLRSEHTFNLTSKTDGPNITLNFCDLVSKAGCPPGSTVCIMKSSNEAPLGLKKNQSQFLKTDNVLKMEYKSSAMSCSFGDDHKPDRVIVEFECDPKVSTGKPELIYFEPCLYYFKWLTNKVCPLFESDLNCTITTADGLQMDLSPLQDISYYVVQSQLHDPKLYYSLSSTRQILLNVCGTLPHRINQTIDCSHSSACMVDMATNTTLNLGRFSQPLRYNEESKTIELLYTDGFDQKTNRAINTKVVFNCKPWNEHKQPYLVDYNSNSNTYTIEFDTAAACPLRTLQGQNCTVFDPYLNHVFDLNKLSAEHYYTVSVAGYEFELNVCAPVKNSTCGSDVAICQKESHGEKRNFSLGKSHSSLIYWNGILNMTFVDGTPYNDPGRTRRKSHISFICDANAGKGHPEFDGEQNQAYFFRWYTSLACPGPEPMVTHCVFQNDTHFFDLSPLSLKYGNHPVFGFNGGLVYINFCRPLNKARENFLFNCKDNSAVCLVPSLSSSKRISLGEPYGHPFTGFDGSVYLIYNNGDTCTNNRSRSFTSRIRLECDAKIDDLVINMIDPQDDPLPDGQSCNYEFIVHSKYACPRPLTDLTLHNCVYTDQRTNFTADLNPLTNKFDDYKLRGPNGPHSSFVMNLCKSVNAFKEDRSKNCTNAAVCLRDADNTIVSYGNTDQSTLYMDNDNLHLRFASNSVCTSEPTVRTRAADIEFICDHSAHGSSPSVYFSDHCLVKLQWRTPAVCNLAVPSCSLLDPNSGDYYSLRQLASLSHVWNTTGSKTGEFYVLNVCKPLPSEQHCGTDAAACKCTQGTGLLECHNIGKVSNNELFLDPSTKDLILFYEDGSQVCNNAPTQTRIRFRCSNHANLSGPKFVGYKDCVHEFIWDTVHACSRNNIREKTVHLPLDSNFVLKDEHNHIQWKLDPLFGAVFSAQEPTIQRPTDNYTYVFDFKNNGPKTGSCNFAAVCQTKPNNWNRDIGSIENWYFTNIGSELYMTLHSNSSKCGRNSASNVTTNIHFHCVPSVGVGQPRFMFESMDCDYHFMWETSLACISIQDNTIPSDSAAPSKSASGMSLSLLLFFFLLFFMFTFLGWLFISHSSRRDDVVYHIRRIFRRNESPQIPFRYQQLSL